VAGTWGSANFLFGGLAIFAKVAHAARRMEADGVTHVHCHFANHPALAGFVIHRLTGIPYSFTAHGSDLHKDRRMLTRKVEEAAFVATISDYNRRLILEECGERLAEKVVVVHCGVDTAVFQPRMAGIRPARPFTIVCVGTLHEVKGQTHLVEACRLLAAAGFDFVCHLVGGGPDHRRLERQIAEAGLDRRAVLEGNLRRAEIATLLGDADVLAAPSVPTRSGKREGIPVVLMEALSSGIPVVASRLSGIPELVEDGVTGLLVPPGDPQSLADALRRLRADPALCRRLGGAGREKVRREFDVHLNAAALASRFSTESSR
jgi:glycosyltransferase involved in cell wall biosynthesis